MKTVKINDDTYEAIQDLARARRVQIRQLTEEVLDAFVSRQDMVKVRTLLAKAEAEATKS